MNDDKFGQLNGRRYLVCLIVGAPLAALFVIITEDWLELPQILWYPPMGILAMFVLVFIAFPWCMNMPSFWTLFKMWRKRRKA